MSNNHQPLQQQQRGYNNRYENRGDNRNDNRGDNRNQHQMRGNQGGSARMRGPPMHMNVSDN